MLFFKFKFLFQLPSGQKQFIVNIVYLVSENYSPD